MATERRNHVARATLTQWVVARFAQMRDDVIELAELWRDGSGVRADAAERVVKRLAILGLARHVGGGRWAPTPLLRAQFPLEPVPVTA
jgi:hypothetical protein